MHLDPEDPLSCTRTIIEVSEHLTRLRAMLVNGMLNNGMRSRIDPSATIRIGRPALMLVRLHSDESGALWYNTDDAKYDTQVGVAWMQISLSAADSDQRLSYLAGVLVGGVAKRLAERKDNAS